MAIKRIPSRQLELGDAGFFEVRAEDPAANQVSLRAGSVHRGGMDILQNALYPADQPTVGFAVVTAGFRRYDLVSIDASGAAVITPGYELAAAVPALEGAPGWTGPNPGIQVPDGLVPLAYVRIDEPATVLVSSTDITAVGGIYSLGRNYDGYLVDKALLGGAPSGVNNDVTALFAAETRVSSSGGAEPNSGGGISQAGFVTTATLNYVHLVDQAADEILHSTGARMYGRLTEAAGSWTLTYFYTNGAGVETSMDPSTDTSGAAPTDLQLIGVPRVFSRNDPARPLFDSNVARLSDQIAGDIPFATTTIAGKVELAGDGENAANVVVQGNDSRLASGTRILTMTTDITLLVTDEINQKLDPDGADRNVTLLAATTQRAFRIFNTGLFNIIRVLSPAGRYVADVAPDAAVWLFPDGVSEWLLGPSEEYTQDFTGQTYSFGMDGLGNNQFVRPFGHANASNAGNVIDNPGSYQIIHVAGFIDQVLYKMDSAQTHVYELWIDGAPQAPMLVTPGAQVNAPGIAIFAPIFVSAGTRIAIRAISGDTPRCLFAVRVRNTTDGYLVPFAGNITANDAWYIIAGLYGTSTNVTVASSQHSLTLYAPPGGGNLQSLAYSIAGADVGDQIDIFIAGGLAETVTLTGGLIVNGALVGVRPLSSAFANGNSIQIRGKDSANMNAATISIRTDVGGFLVPFRGDPATRQYFVAWRDSSAAGGISVIDDSALGIYPRRGRPILTWYCTVTPTADFLVRRQRQTGGVTAAMDVTTGPTGTLPIPMTALPSDAFQIASQDGVGGNSTLAIIVQ